MKTHRHYGDSSTTGLSRRQLLQASAVTFVATATVAACDTSTEPAGQGDGNGDQATEAKEAPMLAQQVESGDLPAVEERLPDSPMVVEPFDQPGTYGGTWTTALLGEADTAWLHRTIGYQQLMRWDLDWTDPLPNVAESVEPNEDGSVYTIHLRPGMKWSDGEPYTSDDVVFWYNDVLANDEMELQGVPSFMNIDGEDGVMEAVDDHTVQVTFAGPNGLFMENLPAPSGLTLVGRPRHYIEQFHADYNPDVETLVEEEGAANWVELLDTKAGTGFWTNPDIPTINPWILTSRLGDSDRLTAERNPYFWKTDPDGRQLPYLDQVTYQLSSDPEVILLRGTNGELDMHARHITTLANKPVLAQSRESGNYKFFDMTPSSMNNLAISLNLTHKNDVMRDIFNNIDFRIGLSHAINRQEVIDTVYQRQGEPWQLAPRPEDPLYDEEYAKQYTEFDLANQHLDQAGYTERDGNDFRLGPNGERIQFAIDVTADQPDRVDALELIKDYWAAVGIDIQVSQMDRALLYERKEWTANDHDVTVWNGPAGLRDMYVDPRCYMPFSAESNYATPWAAWFTSGGEDGEEPPEAPKEQMELYEQMRATLDLEGREELMRQILEIGKEQFYALGVSLTPVGYGIVKNNFHNVPEEMTSAWQYVTPGPTSPEQYFLDE